MNTKKVFVEIKTKVMYFLFILILILVIDSCEKSNRNNVISDPVPRVGFSVSNRRIPAGDSVEFKDSSLYNPISWYWTFGDGRTSMLKNPSHTYVNSGIYSIGLKVSNNVGSDSIRLKDFIFVSDSGTCVGCETGQLIDIEGNKYKTVRIGNQIWMAQNLKTTRFNDNSGIPLFTDSIKWGKLITPGYCWYMNNELLYKNPYGALYNWYTVNTGKLCPSGWHVPTYEEWAILSNYLGGDVVSGGKLKENGNGHWKNIDDSVDNCSTNESGFAALPGGYRYGKEVPGYGFHNFSGNIGLVGSYWSDTQVNDANAYRPDFSFSNCKFWLSSEHYEKIYGASIRCLKDK